MSRARFVVVYLLFICLFLHNSNNKTKIKITTEINNHLRQKDNSDYLNLFYILQNYKDKMKNA